MWWHHHAIEYLSGFYRSPFLFVGKIFAVLHNTFYIIGNLSCQCLVCGALILVWHAKYPVTTHNFYPLWRHPRETFSALLALGAGNSPVTDEFPSQRPVTRDFDVSFDLRLKKQLNKQSRRWWFETPARSLWRHYNGVFWLCAGSIAGLNKHQHQSPEGNASWNISPHHSNVIWASRCLHKSTVCPRGCPGQHQRKHWNSALLGPSQYKDKFYPMIKKEDVTFEMGVSVLGKTVFI